MPSPSPSRSAPPAPLQPGGESASTVSAKANQINIANEFLAQLSSDLRQQAGDDFEKVRAEVICTEEFWGHLASFLCFTYKIKGGRKNAGKPLDEDTAIPIWSGLINQAKQRFSKGGLSEGNKVWCCTAAAHTPEHAARTHTPRTCRAHALPALLTSQRGVIGSFSSTA